MFGSKRREELYQLLESMIQRMDRLDNNGNAIRDRIRDIEAENQALRIRVEQLEKKQDTLRDRLKVLAYPFINDTVIVDHVHVNNDLAMCPSEECIYCHRELNTHNND